MHARRDSLFVGNGDDHAVAGGRDRVGRGELAVRGLGTRNAGECGDGEQRGRREGEWK
jgi:hypothetical protein